MPQDTINPNYGPGGGPVTAGPALRGGTTSQGGGGGMTGFDPFATFGHPQGPAYSGYQGPFQAHDPSSIGTGLEGLPETFGGWSGAARYAFAPASQFAQQMQGPTEMFRNQMNKDWGSALYGLSQQAIETQFQDASRRQQEGLTRAGYGGGTTVSPLASMGLQNEAQARAGAFGPAAQQAVIQAQAMQTEAARNYQNAISQTLQSWLVPAQIQAGVQSGVPISAGGPSLIGPSLNLAGSVLGAMQ